MRNCWRLASSDIVSPMCSHVIVCRGISLSRAAVNLYSLAVQLNVHARYNCIGFTCFDLSERVRVHDLIRRRDVPAVRHPRRPGDRHVPVLTHHLRHHVRGVLQERPAAWRLRRLQLQCLRHPETRPSHSVLRLYGSMGPMKIK